MARTPTEVDTAPKHSPLEPVFPWVVFDMDGTLVDTFRLNLGSFNCAVRRFLKRSLTVEDALDIRGGTLEEQLINYMPRSAVPRAVERFHAYYTRHFSSATRVFPEIRRLLFKLHSKGVKVAVCTGAGGRIARLTLARSELCQFFDTVVTASDVNRPKPDPEGLRIVISKTGADSCRTVYVRDHPDDIGASRNAGVKSAAAMWGSMHRDELHSLNPDFLFRRPSEALTLSALRLTPSLAGNTPLRILSTSSDS
jgi:HAD superfamily hydrolase (TIGR01509 family)